jgi:pimeloyl-ACP methyl ester carboxylesterase
MRPGREGSGEGGGAVPEANVDGVTIAYEVRGSGDPVVLVCGTGQAASSWDLHLVPALLAAGFEVVTFDNRGMPPSASPTPPYSAQAMARDVEGLIEQLGLGSCKVLGYSLGAFVTQELCLARPDLVRAAVLVATFGRQDAFRRALMKSWVELDEAGIELPRYYETVASSFMLLSPHFLDREEEIERYISTGASMPAWKGPGKLGQHQADFAYDNRLEALEAITVPTLVVGFELDMITPRHLCQEVADAIENARYLEIAQTGHAGLFEKPEEFNRAVVDFLSEV